MESAAAHLASGKTGCASTRKLPAARLASARSLSLRRDRAGTIRRQQNKTAVAGFDRTADTSAQWKDRRRPKVCSSILKSTRPIRPGQDEAQKSRRQTKHPELPAS